MSKDSSMTMNPEYRHLELAIDSRRMRERLERELRTIWKRPINLEDFLVTRVFPRGNGGFAIQYSMVAETLENHPEKRLLLYGRLLGPSESSPAYAEKDNRNVIVLNDLRLVVPLFPFDPELSQLPAFCQKKKVSVPLNRLGDHLLLTGRDFIITSYEVLGYRLERRCVLRYTLCRPDGQNNQSDEIRLIAKIFRPQRSAGAMQTLNWLERNGFHPQAKDRITVPHVYHYDAELGVIFMENAPGISLHFLIGKAKFKKACSDAGRLLRKLHSFDTRELKQHTAMDEMASFRKRFDVTTRLYAALRGSFERTLESLNRGQAYLAGEYANVCTHSDFYDKQVLYSAERTTLLDCDNLSKADAALDYANFLAHLILRQLQAPNHAKNIETGMKAFAYAYGEFDHDFATRARWWLAATLTRLAALYSLRPRWRHLAPILLEDASRSLEQEKLIFG